MAMVACANSNGLPKLPAQATGPLGRYELADSVHTNAEGATAYRFAKASLGDAERVARAFAIASAPKFDKDGWSFGPYGTAVEGVQPPSAYVAMNGRFKLINDGGVGHYSTRPPEPAPTTPPTVAAAHFSDQYVKRIALHALKAAGGELPDASVSVPYTDGHFYEVVVAGRVGRMKADGYNASVFINQEKTITDADGIVTSPKSVGSYRLASLRRAVARLNAGFGVVTCPPQSLMGLPGVISCGMQPAGRPDAATRLTGVTVGLMMSYDGKNAWLIPAFFFTTSDHKTVTTPAAADKYFARTGN